MVFKAVILRKEAKAMMGVDNQHHQQQEQEQQQEEIKQEEEEKHAETSSRETRRTNTTSTNKTIKHRMLAALGHWTAKPIPTTTAPTIALPATTTAPPPPPPPPTTTTTTTRRKRRSAGRWKEIRGGVPYITFTISFGLLVDMAAYGLMVPVLPFRLESIGYHNIPAKSSYLIAAFAFGLIVSSVPIGIFGELVKARKVPLLFCLVFLAASLILFWLSSSFVVLIIARLLQGVSGTGIWTLGLALICDVVPEERIGVIMGYVMIGWSIGAVGGPLAGGLLYDSLGYHSVFVFALILTGLDFVMRLLVHDEPQSDSCDDGGAEVHGPEPFSSSSAAHSLSDETARIPEPPTAVGLLLDIPPAAKTELDEDPTAEAASPAKAKRISHQHHHHHHHHTLIAQSSYISSPMPPTASRALLSLLSSGRCLTLFAIIFVLGFCFGGLLDSGMTLLVHARYGLNSRSAALVFIGAVVPSFASSPLAGHFADKHGARLPVVICLILGTPFFGLISMEGSLSTFIVWIALTGLFIMGIAAPIMQDLAEVVKVTPGLGYAHVYGIFNMIYSTGSLVGPLCVGGVMERTGIERGWRVTSLICTGLCAASIIPAWMFIGNHPTITALNLNSRTLPNSRKLAHLNHHHLHQPSPV
ncbi:hypothetical protein PCASD_18069 [Puccinia coronata f. sp. avenae]|uniref:Major facilitator superfamily (MFS) profile domain-containing protein n=1 Tax=Puccinia coronata f. sp. avenae TaxID=200324 RepID=A0A2N5U0I5_9BASI|nr:hypothetical protein PCASD_18069 [Puccinia coronata f. sp. avenae]